MEVELVEDGPCTRTLTFRIPPERIRDHLDEVYRQASTQVNIKGFRAGKVPRKVLEKKFGDAIRSEAKESLINRTFNEAIRERNLEIVGRPRVEGIDDNPLVEDQAIEFQVQFDIRPQIELKDVTGIEVEAQSTAVTDDDVQQVLQQMADRKKTLDVVEGAVEDGDFVRADLTWVDGEGNTVQERTGQQLNTNIPIAGTDPEEFKSRLIGSEKGQQTEVELTFPPNFEKQELRSQRGTVRVTLQEVLRVQAPPIDDELARGFDADSLDELRAELRGRIGEEKVRSERMRQEEAILQVIANDHPFDLPAKLVEDQAKHQLEDYARRLRENDVVDQEVEQKVDAAREEAAADAQRRIRLFFLIDAIARKEKIFVTESDVDVELRRIAAQHGTSADEVREHYEKQKLLEELRVGIMERKVRDYLREKARITDKNGETED